MTTSTKPNKNSPVLQHTQTVLPSGSNALRISLEHATLWVSSAEIAEISRRMLCSSYSRVWGFFLYNLPSNFPTNISHKSLPLLGTCPPGNWHQKFLRRFPADSYSKYFTPNTQDADLYVRLDACCCRTEWFTEKCITSSKRGLWCKSFRLQLKFYWHGICQLPSTA
jgi:hypothetical protein